MIIKETMTEEEAKKLLGKISFYLEDFNSFKTIKDRYYLSTSPLFVEEVLDNVQKSTAIEAAITTAPLYHVESNTFGTTRDPAHLDIHSYLTSEFWTTLTRHALGSEYNNLITRVHNSLAFPSLSEEQLVYSGVFKRFLDEQLVSFDTDTEDLNDILDKKLSGVYSLLDYKPAHSNFISSWIESGYLSGALSYDGRVIEERLYQVQDIKNELLRRKFAGSSTLYDIVASAINRRASYVPVVPITAVSSGSSFKDDRLIRALDLPGITTVLADTIIDPLSVFEDSVPIRTLKSLYYSSRDYNSTVFAENRALYLRNRSTVLNWDNLKGILDASQVKKTYPRLDTYDQLASQPIALDTFYPDSGKWLALDDDSPMFDMGAVTGGFFDLQADQALFHRNTFQLEDPVNYEFVTYSLAGDAAITMMDIPWLEHVRLSAEDKKRVQETLYIGTQLSTYTDTPRGTLTENFTVMTFSDVLDFNFDTHSATYDSNKKYAYVWSVKIRYFKESFERTSQLIVPELITYILFKVDTTGIPEETLIEYSNHPSYDAMVSSSVGLLPFTYKDLSSSAIGKMRLVLDANEITDDFYEQDYNKAIFLFTPYENAAIGKAYSKTPPSILVGSGDWGYRPSLDTSLKHFIFGVSRTNVATKEVEYFWSDPIRVYPKILYQARELHPDWMDLAVYVNPYLNFRSQCASPIRKKAVLGRASRPAIPPAYPDPEPAITGVVGPGTNTALMNLIYDHNMHVYTNNTGTTTDPNYPRGSYLRKVRPANPTTVTERLEIWGDNRALWGSELMADPMNDWANDKVRDRVYVDDSAVECLMLRYGNGHVDGEADDSYYTIAPQNSDTKTNDWKQWYWNRIDSNGLTFCIDLTIDDTEQDQYFVSRVGPTGSVPNAEFEAYFEVSTSTLVFKVYPTGFTTGHAFEVRKAASHMLDQQSQVAFSYQYEADEDDPSKLNITMSIVADRIWEVKYFTTKKTTGSTWQYEETDADFEFLTPTTVDLSALTSWNHEQGYGGNYRFGMLIKNGVGQAENNLGPIALFNRGVGSVFGYNSLNAHIYDVRLYSRGMKLHELLTVCAGTKRELYSYSPAIYKLHHMQSSDLAVLKRFNSTHASNETPGSIRIFKRSVWDSIIVDLYGQSSEEMQVTNPRYDATYYDTQSDSDVYVIDEGGVDYVDGVVEQMLVNNYESIVNTAMDANVPFFYRGREKDIIASDIYNLVQTSIYPHRYDDTKFISGLKLVPAVVEGLTGNKLCVKAAYDAGGARSPIGSAPAQIPVSASGDTLEYRGVFDLNFKLPTTIDASSPLAKGDGLYQDYDTTLRQFLLRTVSSENIRTRAVGSAQNYAMYPLYIPDQGANESNPFWEGYFYGFDLYNMRLSKELSRLMNATSYYTEVQIPIGYIDAEDKPKYTYRSHAMRGLKEGEYFVTIKYPIAIIPAEGEASKPVMAYATARVKIVAKGSPVFDTTESDSTISKDYDVRWDFSKRTVKHTQYVPTDNRTFPHRIIDLDLYVQRNTGTVSTPNWSWVRIASNHDETDSVDLYNSVKDSLLISKGRITAYLSKSYLTPFFVGDDISSATSTDLVSFTIKGASNSDEVLTYSSVDELSDVVLLSKKSYRVMFDFTGNVTEFGYTSVYNTPTPVESVFDVTDDEVDNYIAHIDLIENKALCCYTLPPDSILRASSRMVPKELLSKTGFAINQSNQWEAASANTYLGDPYALSKTKNRQYMYVDDSRHGAIESMSHFQYKVANTQVNVPGAFLDRISYLKKQADGSVWLSTTAVGEFNEYSIVQSMSSRIIQTAKNLIRDVLVKAKLFDGIGNIQARQTGASLERITPNTHKLVQFRTSALKIPLSLGLRSTSTTSYRSNKAPDPFESIFFSGIQNKMSYEYDATFDKDVYSFEAETADSVVMSYKRDVGGLGHYKVQIKVKSSAVLKAELKIIPYVERTSSSMLGRVVNNTLQTLFGWVSSYITGESLSGGWTLFTWTVPKALDPVTMQITFKQTSNAAFNGELIALEGFSVYKRKVFTNLLGLSEAKTGSLSLNAIDSLPILGVNGVAMQYKGSRNFFPLQFKCTLNEAGALNSGSVNASTFLSNYSIGDLHESISGISKDNVLTGAVIRPWTRKIIFLENNPRTVKFKKYVLDIDPVTKDKTFSFMDQASSIGPFNVSQPSEYLERSIRYDAREGEILFDGTYGLILDLDVIKGLCNCNLELNTDDPVAVIEERFSAVNGCVNPDKFLAGLPSPVAITNIQILNNAPDHQSIIYELEYFPIIYDESKHHLSLNMLIRTALE
jgi:hypothetical protein